MYHGPAVPRLPALFPKVSAKRMVRLGFFIFFREWATVPLGETMQ